MRGHRWPYNTMFGPQLDERAAEREKQVEDLCEQLGWKTRARTRTDGSIQNEKLMEQADFDRVVRLCCERPITEDTAVLRRGDELHTTLRYTLYTYGTRNIFYLIGSVPR